MAATVKFIQTCLPKIIYFGNRPVTNTTSKRIHPLKDKLTHASVLKYLSNNILYKDDDIVVFNKPANVAKSPPSVTDGNIKYGETIYIDHLLKDISKLVPDFKDLRIVKFPERYTSGVMIFASSEESAIKLDKIKRRAKGGVELCDTFLTITQGTPILMKNSSKLAVKNEKCDKNSKTVPMLIENWSQWDMKKQRIKLFRISHSVLAQGGMASLIEVSTSSSAKNSLRLYFATKLLSPILGDSIFSSRIQNLMGVPMLIDPWSDVANSNKKLPREFLKALDLTPIDTSLVPLFLHLAEVRLPGYSKRRDLVLQAPVPPIFQWACEQLSLSLQLSDLPTPSSTSTLRNFGS